MSMAYWTKEDGDIILKSCDRIVSIEHKPDGTFDIVECCDRYYRENYTKQQLIDLLHEAMHFVITRDMVTLTITTNITPSSD